MTSVRVLISLNGSHDDELDVHTTGNGVTLMNAQGQRIPIAGGDDVTIALSCLERAYRDAERWLDARRQPMHIEDAENIDADPDRLTREQLAEHDPMWKATADVLDEWLARMHGIMSSGHHVGTFLDLLADRGYRVSPIADCTLTLAPSED